MSTILETQNIPKISEGGDRIHPAETLTPILAQLIDLRQQVKQSHWNITGPSFIGLHRLLDEFAIDLTEQIDITAERQRALGSAVRGSLLDANEISTLKDYPDELTAWEDVLRHLVEIYRQLSAELVNASEVVTEAKDFGTADLFADCIRLVDQHVYLMTSHFTVNTL